MNIYLLLIFFGILTFMSDSNATTALGDADDETSLYMWGGGSLSANFKDKSVKIGYMHSKSDKPLSYGITLKGRSTSDASIIFDGDKVNPETTITVPIGYHWILSEKPQREELKGFIIDDWFFLEIKYTSAQYQMFDSSRTFESQLYKEEMHVPSLALSYNAITSGNILFGASLEFGKANNYSDLTSKEVKTTTSVGDSASITRVTQTTISTKQGEYREFNQSKFNIDAMIIPGYFDNRVGLDLFARYRDASEHDSTYVNIGAGIFLLKDGAPTQIVGGLTFMRDDKKNENILGLVVGYNF